jgi:hypothetical protein
MVRRSRLTSAALGLLLLAACGSGDDDGAALRVVVRTASFDGPPPQVFAARQTQEGPEAPRPLVRDPESGDLLLPAGEPGQYVFHGEGGWGMLSLDAFAPEWVPGVTLPVTLGRPRSVYVRPKAQGPGLSGTWAATDAAGRTIPTTVDVDPDGRYAALRFAEGTYEQELRVIGLLRDGSLLEEVRVQPRDERPRLAAASPSVTFPLDVLLVAPSAGARRDGVRVSVSVVGIPVAASWTETTRGGVARFPAVSTLGDGISVDVEGARGPIVVPVDVWIREADVRVFLPGPAPGREAVVAVPADLAVDRVQVRAAAADSFALVPVARSEAGLHVPLPPEGKADVLLDAGTRRALLRDVVEGPRPAPDFVEGVRVKGPVPGGSPGTIVRFLREDGDRLLSIQGALLRLGQAAVYEAVLPVPGTWRVEVESPTGPWRHRAPQTFDTPGQSVHLGLRTRDE